MMSLLNHCHGEKMWDEIQPYIHTMIDPKTRKKLIALVHKQVVPAIGCTEPICVALACARATEKLQALTGRTDLVPSRIDVRLSANILKNAMGVGIPGTGMVGLPIAIALGALIGKSEYGLEVLRDCTPEAVAQGRKFIDEGRIDVRLATTEDFERSHVTPDEKLFVDICAHDEEGHCGCATIAHEHTHFTGCVQEANTSIQAPADQDAEELSEIPDLNMQMVYDFATTAPLEEIAFINEAGKLNMEAAKRSLEHNYGHCLGKAMHRPLGRGLLGDTIFSHVLMATSSACDARMAGAMIPVMSNSGSGNQGICATNPVMVFAEENHNTYEERTRALMLSHLTAIYIKRHLGSLSALCGCVVASTGSSVGITYLMGGKYEQVTAAIKNMIANLTGMICDGAKPSCALKLTSGVTTAMLSAMLAVQGECVTEVEGIIDRDVDRSIRNLATIGSKAMNETDLCVLKIMTNK